MKVMLSKEEFVNHIEGMREQNDGELMLYNEFGIDTIDIKRINYASVHFTELLSQAVGDKEEWVGWWCYETDFGRDSDMTKIYDSLGEKVIANLETAGDLYDYLVKITEDEE